MLEVKTSIVINVPPSEVFDYMTNPANMRQWRIDVTKYRDLPTTPFAKGHTWVEESHHLGRISIATVEVLDIVQNQFYTIKTLADNVAFVNTYQFEPVADGTQIHFQLQSDIPIMLKLIEPLMKNNSVTLIEKNLKQLKYLLESKQ